MKKLTIRVTETEEQRLKHIALKLGYIYDGKPSVSKILKKIAQGELKIYSDIFLTK